MKKKTIALTLFIFGFFTVEAFAQVKIGYTNPARILSQLPEVEEVDKQIEALLTEKDEQLAAEAESLRETFSQFESESRGLTEAQRAQRQQELLELNEQFETQRNKMLDEVRNKRNELMRPIIEKMNNAMAEVAAEMELDMILNEGTSTGDMIIFYADSEKLDVTQKIIDKIK